jgi:hypothetical protein
MINDKAQSNTRGQPARVKPGSLEKPTLQNPYGSDGTAHGARMHVTLPQVEYPLPDARTRG